MKIENLNKKAGSELTIRKIISLTLIVLVIVIVFMFSFKSFREKIWDYFKNLPGYSYNESDKEIDASKLKPDELSSLGCKEIIGKIGIPEGNWLWKGQYIYIKNEKTNLYWDDRRKKIWLDRKWGDIEIGSISEGGIGKIEIYPQFLNEKSEDYLKYEEGLPYVKDLKLLNNSFKLENGNYLCR